MLFAAFHGRYERSNDLLIPERVALPRKFGQLMDALVLVNLEYLLLGFMQ
jgi:hypothetical protein